MIPMTYALVVLCLDCSRTRSYSTYMLVFVVDGFGSSTQWPPMSYNIPITKSFVVMHFVCCLSFGSAYNSASRKKSNHVV